MSDPFVGEIRMYAGIFLPRGWALCDGQLLAIDQYDSLFAQLGTIYGGDGRKTFGLPDLRGRIPLHAGSAPGLSPRRLGAKGGAEAVTLTVSQIPSHSHSYQAVSASGNESDPRDALAAGRLGDPTYRDGIPSDTNMSTQGVTNVGGGREHSNLMPFLCVNFIIALFGVDPIRQ